jgi:hypothetical protein
VGGQDETAAIAVTTVRVGTASAGHSSAATTLASWREQ